MLSTPVAMKRMKLRLMDADAQLAANILAGLSVIHLEETEDDTQFKDFPAAEFHQYFHRIHSRFKKIASYMEQPLNESASSELTEPVSMQQMLEADEKLRQIWSEVSQYEEQQRQLKEQSSAINQLTGSLQRFLSLDIDLNRLGHKSQFLNVRSGMVASTNTAQLKRALSISGYVIEIFYTGDGVDYVVIVGSTLQEREVEDLLRTADFRELTIPEEFSDRPQQVSQRLEQQQRDINTRQQQAQQKLRELIDSQQPLLMEIGRLIYRAMAYANLAAFLKGKGQLLTLQGWVPESRMDEIEAELQGKMRYPFQLLFESPGREELSQVPTKLRQNWLLKPFNQLIGQFGLPQYGEYDPGILFALSYTLMFGMMFGDIGHGGIIVFAALLFIRRMPALTVIAGLAGLSSMFFGWLYGSVFGYEDILHPVWMSPMHDPQHVLMLALYWGIGFLVIANLLSIRNTWVMGQFAQALYSPQGVAGLVFYLSGVGFLLFGETQGLMLSLLLKVLVVLAMLVMLVYQWSHSTGAFFERVLVVVIEGLEIVINSVSSTLSFLRVAAFSLNHIALASAVFAIAAMMDSFGHGVSILLGNIFIIVLEGAIVAIQCLRLEYYEGFSRFFSGKGKPYQPLSIEPI